jgi:hypothetical protein
MIDFEMKKFFFDRTAVKNAIGAVATKNLGAMGAFIQRKAKSLIRRRKKVSLPGQPPSARSTDSVASIKNIWFAYDPATQSVVVGPLKLNGSRHHYVVPEILEYGGTASMPSGKRANYRARPFMNPAKEESINNPKLMEIWRDSVKG